MPPNSEPDLTADSKRQAPSELVKPDAPITVYDRTTTLSLLFRETDRVQRLNTSLCVLLIAVDFNDFDSLRDFKAGDHLIRQFVTRTAAQLRTYDLFGRMTSHEFLLALPGCNEENAIALAERMQTEVFAAPFSVANRATHLSACFAIAASRGRSPVVVLRELEQALAQAKREGPGSIQCSSQHWPPDSDLP